MSRFQFVADHRHAFEVKWLSEVVEIARSSFYAWCAAADGRDARAAADEALAERIRVVHDDDNTYGAPRITCPDHREILQWITGLPAPVAVTYEAGPTGFGLARALTGAGIDCRVAAPSKVQRPAGDRVKTDAREWQHRGVRQLL